MKTVIGLDLDICGWMLDRLRYGVVGRSGCEETGGRRRVRFYIFEGLKIVESLVISV